MFEGNMMIRFYANTIATRTQTQRLLNFLLFHQNSKYQTGYT